MPAEALVGALLTLLPPPPTSGPPSANALHLAVGGGGDGLCAALDGVLSPHSWDQHYRQYYGPLSDFLLSRPDLFAERWVLIQEVCFAARILVVHRIGLTKCARTNLVAQ